MRAEEGFQFPALASASGWETNAAFRAAVIRHLSISLPAKEVQRLSNELHSFAGRCRDEYSLVSATMDSYRAEPYLIQYDAWGNRIDQLVTSSGWKELKKIAARESIVGEIYDAANTTGGGRSKLGPSARVYAFARSIIFGPVSKVVLCPVSMSDGAVRVLELYGTPKQKEMAIPRLLSIDPSKNWTAGQFMTERPGGSDVAKTETKAQPVDANKVSAGDKFILNGFKWFSSATDGDIALALARTDESQPESSKGLSLFLIRLRDEQTGKLNGIRIHRLKNKLGTRYLPTAELELDNCMGELVGTLNKGVATISSVLNITRLYSACGALAGLGHGQQIATAFAGTRHVSQSQLLGDLPLHTATLLNVAVLYRALLQLFFSTALLMGKVESGVASREESLRSRFLTPALKAFSATRASEGYITLIESMGGQGYMEENGLAEALRDLTVERIWEGTPAIMSLDLLRVIIQSQGAALSSFISDNLKALNELPEWIQEAAKESIGQLSKALHEIGDCMSKVDIQHLAKKNDFRIGRPLLDCVMTTLAGVLLFQQAAWRCDKDNHDVVKLAKIDIDEAAGLEDVETAKLWIEGGHGDLNKSLTMLRSLSCQQSSASMAQRIVYGKASL